MAHELGLAFIKNNTSDKKEIRNRVDKLIIPYCRKDEEGDENLAEGKIDYAQIGGRCSGNLMYIKYEKEFKQLEGYFIERGIKRRAKSANGNEYVIFNITEEEYLAVVEENTKKFIPDADEDLCFIEYRTAYGSYNDDIQIMEECYLPLIEKVEKIYIEEGLKLLDIKNSLIGNYWIVVLDIKV